MITNQPKMFLKGIIGLLIAGFLVAFSTVNVYATNSNNVPFGIPPYQAINFDWLDFDNTPNSCNFRIGYEIVYEKYPNANDGEINLKVENATGNLTYRWGNMETKKHLKGLSAGDYYVTVTDEAGCTLPAMLSVEAHSDNIPPTVVPQDIIVYLDESGQVSIFPDEVDGGSTDNAGFAFPTSVVPNTFETAGEYTVLLTVEDGNGNFATSTAKVVVEEGTPIIVEQAPIENLLQEQLEIKAFPNPFVSTLNLDGFLPENSGSAFLTIMDIKGQVIKQQQFMQDSGVIQEQLDLDNLSAGTYFLKIQTEEALKTIKIVKIH